MSCGSWRASRARCRSGWSSSSASATARSFRGCAGSTTTCASRSRGRTRSRCERRRRCAERTSGRSSEFTVEAGERASFVLTWFPSHHVHDDLPEAGRPRSRRSRRRARSGASGSRAARYEGRWQEPVRRSLMTLKALTYQPTGGIVAAPTTSLPEQIGGTRNWDYRYCWLRDATFALDALLECGFRDEAEAWRSWLLRAVAGDPDDLQIMYGAAGERRLTEFEIPWLSRLRELTARPRRQQRQHAVPARRLRRGPRRAPPGAPARDRARTISRGRSSESCSRTSSGAGTSPTRESGRCAGHAATSPTRR